MDETREEDRRRAVIETLQAAQRLLVASTGAVEELRTELEAATDRRAARRRRRGKEGRDWFGLGMGPVWRRERLIKRAERLLQQLDLPTRREIEALNRRIDELNARLDDLTVI